MTVDPALLLAGPRGRRLCLEFVRGLHGDTHGADQLGEAIFFAAFDLDPGRGTSRVIARTDEDQYTPPHHSPEEIARLLAVVPLPDPDELAVLSTLVATVDSARYWQEPDGEDVLAAAPELREPLARISILLANSPHSAWWATPLAQDTQWAVDFEGVPAAQGITRTASETLERWHAAQVDEEVAAKRERPADPRAARSGTWWSKPPTDLTRTTRSLNARGPAGLWLVEDNRGWDHATVRQIHVPAGARVFEIDSPDALAHLCQRFPLDITASRRHDWYRTTARNGRWVIPDWARVARNFDAVHLTVAGYLSSAGLAVPVENDQMTVLAGWDPDQTFWLKDVVQDEPAVHAWGYDQDEGWTVSAAR